MPPSAATASELALAKRSRSHCNLRTSGEQIIRASSHGTRCGFLRLFCRSCLPQMMRPTAWAVSERDGASPRRKGAMNWLLRNNATDSPILSMTPLFVRLGDTLLPQTDNSQSCCGCLRALPLDPRYYLPSAVAATATSALPVNRLSGRAATGSDVAS